ncbi:MAG: DUF4157 domain-containing protein [Nitrospirales bacterium]|nr:DUF4157 domain-containing protein [Nitrospirales bacterium]
MNKTSVAQQGNTSNNFWPTQGMLQRKCACGNHKVGGGECADCAKKKGFLQRKLTIGASNDPLEQEADRIAEQVMAAPAPYAVGGVLPRIQRFPRQSTEETYTAPASVDHVLASAGRPLEPALRQDMEQRFGQDFSRVRVYTGAAAEQSARDVNALAYTVGHNIVFGAGRFAPATNAGQRMLAHELTHVVQESVGANQIGVIRGDVIRGHPPVPVLRRDPQPAAQSRPAPTGIQLAEVLPFGHNDLRSDELKRRYRTYLGAVTRLQVTPAGDYRAHCAKEYLTEVANTCPPRFAELRSGGFCTGNKCLDFGRWGTAGDSNTGKTVTDTQDSFIDLHRTRHSESLLEGTGKNRCSVVCHQRFKFDRQRDLGSFYIIRNFRADQYTPTGSTQPLHITTGEVNKVQASLAAPTPAEFARDIAPGLEQSGVLGEAPLRNEG